MKFVFDAKTASIIGAAAFAALVAAAAPAAADPAPVPPPIPAPAPVPAPSPSPVAEAPAQTVTNSAAEPAIEGVPHLLSPENLPPGTTDTPVSRSQPRLTYLRDLWHAMRTQEVSGSDALLLLTQRPMVADATPPQGLSTGPQAPATQAPPLAPVPVNVPHPAPLPVDSPPPAPLPVDAPPPTP
ncbi:MAG: hypothetical protein KDB44_09740 [Mycobacterium sp.]|nr:hypothetical protein [Mycobacterium sp.]